MTIILRFVTSTFINMMEIALECYREKFKLFVP